MCKDWRLHHQTNDGIKRKKKKYAFGPNDHEMQEVQRSQHRITLLIIQINNFSRFKEVKHALPGGPANK